VPARMFDRLNMIMRAAMRAPGSGRRKAYAVARKGSNGVNGCFDRLNMAI